MSDSVRPHRQQPTRLRSPWDSPGKNTGVGCYFRLQCMKVKSESEVRLSDPMDWNLPYTKTNDCYSFFLISNIRHISSAISKSFLFGREISWLKGFPGGTSGKKNPACHCRRCKRSGFDPEAWENWCFQINAIIA